MALRCLGCRTFFRNLNGLNEKILREFEKNNEGGSNKQEASIWQIAGELLAAKIAIQKAIDENSMTTEECHLEVL